MTTNIGIIGAGHMGYLHLLSCIKIKKNFSVKGVADKSKSIRKKIEEYKINTYDDYKTMLEKEDLDCLIISLPNFLKKECIEFSSQYDVKMFVDKPIARSYQETKEIYDILTKNKNKLMVGVNYRYHPNIIKLKELLDSGQAGKIRIANYELIMNGPFSHPRTPRPLADWYIDPEKSGGGAIIDLAYHLLDINQWFFGASKLKYSIMEHTMNLPIEDSATIITESSEGQIRSVINVGWFSRTIFPEFNFRVNLHGTNGYISSEKYAPGNLFVHAAFEGINNFFRKITFREINYLTYTYYYSSFYKIINEYLNCVEKDEDFPVKFDDQLEVMRLIGEVYDGGKKCE